MQDEGTKQAKMQESLEAGIISIEYYENQRKEWLEERDKIISGLYMYRFQFEATFQEAFSSACPSRNGS